MKKRALRKLKSRRGETLAETLVSVLVSALALVMLAGAIGAAKNIIANSDQKMYQYYQGISKMGQTNTTGGTSGEGTSGEGTSGEGTSGEGTSGEGTPGGGSGDRLAVTIQNDEGGLIGINGSTAVNVQYQEISVFANTPVVAYWVSQEVTGP